MTAQFGRFLGLDQAALAHGLRLAFAAWLAYAIASLLHVGNAYWAAMPIWVVAQAAKGLLLERGFFRFVGTLLGAGAGFGILQLGLSPYLLLLLLGVWIACATMLVHMLRGVHGYGALMAGMTAAVVVLPSVLRPEHAMELAVARVECTLIGVIVVTLVTGIWTPASLRHDFYKRVRCLARDAIVSALTASAEDAEARERQILREMSEVQANASLVTAGSVEGYRRLHHVDALIVAAFAVMAAGHRLAERPRREGTRGLGIRDEEAGRLADELLASPPKTRDEAQVLLSRIEWMDTRLADALHRLAEADKAFEMEPSGADARSFRRKATYLAPHRDGRLAIETGLLTGTATFMAAILGYVSGWPTGELAALGVCIFSMVLGSLPAPQTVAPMMLKGVSAGVAAALLYRLGIQPHITTTTQLVLSVAPFILVGGLTRASRKTAGPALDANMCFLLASQAVLPAITDRVVILNEATALMLGAGLATSSFMLLPPLRDRRAARAARAVGSDLLRMAKDAAGIGAPLQISRIRRQILRLSLHLGKANRLGTPSGWSLLDALSLAEAIGRLQTALAQPEADPASSSAIREALISLRNMLEDPTGIAEDLERQARSLPDQEAANLLLDAAGALRASRSLLLHGSGQVASR
ncbi:FUSC family protein [Microvirga sp. G4-2]|uniref:FUSC family protein n=1 Tax=Microvirga sp. G4-2 TaxID=3434467 RepID=UPI00404400BF